MTKVRPQCATEPFAVARHLWQRQTVSLRAFGVDLPRKLLEEAQRAGWLLSHARTCYFEALPSPSSHLHAPYGHA